jgi:hypothetical protein
MHDLWAHAEVCAASISVRVSTCMRDWYVHAASMSVRVYVWERLIWAWICIPVSCMCTHMWPGAWKERGTQRLAKDDACACAVCVCMCVCLFVCMRVSLAGTWFSNHSIWNEWVLFRKCTSKTLDNGLKWKGEKALGHTLIYYLSIYNYTYRYVFIFVWIFIYMYTHSHKQTHT